MKTLLCLFNGIFVTFGFLFIVVCVNQIGLEGSRWFNILVAVILDFSIMVLITNEMLVRPAIDEDYDGISPHSRFLFFVMGMWLVIVPYIEVELFKVILFDYINTSVNLIAAIF